MGVDQWVWGQVEKVLAGGVKLAVATTGGGSQAISWLLNHPGASRAVLEAHVPYHENAIARYLNYPGPHPANEETARALAAMAFFRAKAISSGQGAVAGLGCTAALATTRPRKGADRASLCLRCEDEYRYFRLDFVKGIADRLAQEDALSRFLLEVLEGRDEPGFGLPKWAVSSAEKLPLETAVEALLTGEVGVVEMRLDGGITVDVECRGRLLFPGSFNPLHQGHKELAQVAGWQSGLKTTLELSIKNVDKPRLAYREILRRLSSLQGSYPVVLTRAPTFVEKARIFSAPVFVIGADTATRLLEDKYYPGGSIGMHDAWREKYRAGCRFLVAGRQCEGGFLQMEDLAIPDAYRGMFEAIPAARFRRDVSSSQIRAGQV
jgi:hypothetical protein